MSRDQLDFCCNSHQTGQHKGGGSEDGKEERCKRIEDTKMKVEANKR